MAITARWQKLNFSLPKNHISQACVGPGYPRAGGAIRSPQLRHHRLWVTKPRREAREVRAEVLPS